MAPRQPNWPTSCGVIDTEKIVPLFMPLKIIEMAKLFSDSLANDAMNC